MPEDIFRIVITVAVLVACIAFLVQAGLMLGVYRTMRKVQAKVEPLVDRAEPVIGKIGPVIDKVGPVVDQAGIALGKAAPILETTHQIILDTRPRVAAVAEETVAVSKSVRVQVERAGDLLQDAGGRARERLAQIDLTVGATVEQVGEVGEAVKRAIQAPVRETKGIAAGISAAVSTLARGSRRPSVDHATQDEEMFI